MENNNRLNDLFNQAKNEAPKASFEDIKRQFEQSLIITGGSATTGLLTIKNLIMIATVTALSVGTIMIVDSYTKPYNINSNILTIESSEDIALIEEERKKIVFDYLEKVEKLNSWLKKEKEVEQQLALKTVAWKEIIDLKETAQQEYTRNIKRMPNDTSYSFPNLTQEEIEANNKQKAKMLKQLFKIDKKKYAFIPSGTVKINNKNVSVQSFFMQTTEVSNLEYRTFLFDLLIQGKKEEFLMAKPDQTKWMEYGKFMKPMQDNYFSHVAYDNYPINNISREGANLYCRWLTEELFKSERRKAQKMVADVRIPTNYEWMYAASGGGKLNPYPWGGPYLRNAKGCFLANYKPGIDSSVACIKDKTMDDVHLNEKNRYNKYSADGGYFTVNVNSYNPNSFGLYCMSGNVAEMVYYHDKNNLPGTKGGSWSSTAHEIQINGPDKFKGITEASSNIGFRPVFTYLGRPINREFKPYGMTKVSQKLYVDKYEITNAAWKEYLEDLKKEHPNKYMDAYPDTNVWRSHLRYNAPYAKYYFNHPAYEKYPIVGVTYEQVVNFCEWRTEKLKSYYEDLDQNSKKNHPTNFEFRLPTKKEWENIAKAGYSSKIVKELEGKNAQPKANFKRSKKDFMGVAGKLNENADITAPVKSYWPNIYGCYNLMGNVAEMLKTKGIAKGGSWVHVEKDITISKDIPYEKPTCWLGFRCVLEIND